MLSPPTTHPSPLKGSPHSISLAYLNRQPRCSCTSGTLTTGMAVLQQSDNWSVHSVMTLDRGVTHIPRRTQWEGTQFHRARQNATQCKTYELFIPRIFPLIFLEQGGP